jgi:hypothetical protein
MASYNMEIQNIDQLCDLAEMTATIEELHVGVVDLRVCEGISLEGLEILTWQPRY